MFQFRKTDTSIVPNPKMYDAQETTKRGRDNATSSIRHGPLLTIFPGTKMATTALKLTSIYQCLQDKETMERVKHPLFLFIRQNNGRNVAETKHCTMTKACSSHIKFSWESRPTEEQEEEEKEDTVHILPFAASALMISRTGPGKTHKRTR